MAQRVHKNPSYRDRFDRTAAACVILIGAGLAACAGIPEQPTPVPGPQPLRVETPSLDEGLPELPEQRRLAPRLRWMPRVPDEGTFVTLIVREEPRSLPVFEAQAHAGEKEIKLAYLGGGEYLGLVAAPIGAQEVPVAVTVTLIDGTRLTRTLSLLVEPREFPAVHRRLSVSSRFTDEPDEKTLDRIRRERELLRSVLETATGQPLWQGAFELPLIGVTTSPYGQRRLFNNQLRSRHTGLDIDGDTGDPIYAANSGRVVISRDLFYTGNAVYIDHGLGFYTGYFHMSKREVVEGQWVEKGQLLGLVGATGRVTGSHLHWAFYLHRSALDPGSLLNGDFARLSEGLPTPGPARALRQ